MTYCFRGCRPRLTDPPYFGQGSMSRWECISPPVQEEEKHRKGLVGALASPTDLLLWPTEYSSQLSTGAIPSSKAFLRGPFGTVSRKAAMAASFYFICPNQDEIPFVNLLLAIMFLLSAKHCNF